MREKYFFLAFLLLVYSCTDNKHLLENSYTVISLTDFKFDSKLKMSNFVESIEAIPLETTPECLIGEIKRIVFQNGRYYMSVTNGYSNARILVFDELGKYLLKIDNRGQGQGEYLDLSDFILTPKSEIKVAAYKKIVTYDSVGNFIREVPIGNYAREIYPISDDEYVMSYFDIQAHENRALCLVDSKDRISAEFFKMCPREIGKMESFIRLNTFHECENEVYFNYPLCDTIFEIKNEEVIPAYYVDLGNKKVVYDLVEEKDGLNEILDKISKKDYFELLGFQVRPDFLYLGIGDNESKAYIAFYFKKDNRIIGGHYIVDDLFFVNNYISLKYKYMPRNMDGDYLLWPLDPSFLLNGYDQYKTNLSVAEWNQFCQKHKKLTDMCGQLSEDDNPVLLRVRVRK